MQAIYRPSLPVSCATATHFVKGIPTGAFAMSVGSRAKVRAVTEIFSAGGEGDSESSALHDAKDGDLEACRVPTTSREPPAGCAAPLRVELKPIDRRSEFRAQCEETGRNAVCVAWSNRVLSFDKAVDPVEARDVMKRFVGACREGDRDACEHVTTMAASHPKVFPPGSVNTRSAFERGCQLGHPQMCFYFGLLLDEEGNAEGAYNQVWSTCINSNLGCTELGDWVEAGRGDMPPDQRRQFLANVRARSCQFNSDGCEKYALLYKQGLRAQGKFEQLSSRVRQCAADAKRFGPSLSCLFASAAYAFGLGVPRDLQKARQAYGQHCAHRVESPLPVSGTCAFPKNWEP